MKELADCLPGKFKNMMVLTLLVLTSPILGKQPFTAFTVSQKLSIISKKGTVTGKVIFRDRKPINSAAVTIRGTSVGTLTAEDGNFLLKNVPADAELAISRIGLNTVNVRPDLKQPLNIIMEESVINLPKIVVHPAPDIEPLSVTDDEFGIRIKGINDSKPPLFILDGKEISKNEYNQMNADKIEKISLLKESSATEKYGEKGKNGVILITSKISLPVQKTFSFNDIQVSEKGVSRVKKTPFKVTEQLPQFPGGEKRMTYYLSEYANYPVQAKTEKIEGTVLVRFLVSKTGKIADVKVINNVHPVLDTEATGLISSMPPWNPGKQNEIPVEVSYTIPIEFSLK